MPAGQPATPPQGSPAHSVLVSLALAFVFSEMSPQVATEAGTHTPIPPPPQAESRPFTFAPGKCRDHPLCVPHSTETGVGCRVIISLLSTFLSRGSASCEVSVSLRPSLKVTAVWSLSPPVPHSTQTSSKEPSFPPGDQGRLCQTPSSPASSRGPHRLGARQLLSHTAPPAPQEGPKRSVGGRDANSTEGCGGRRLLRGSLLL